MAASKSVAYEERLAEALSEAQNESATAAAAAAAAVQRELEEVIAQHQAAWDEREKVHAAEMDSWRAQLGEQLAQHSASLRA